MNQGIWNIESPLHLVKYWNPTTRVFILRVSRDDEVMAVTSLTMLTKINTGSLSGGDNLCKVRILHVGGTLQKVEKALKKMTECWLEG